MLRQFKQECLELLKGENVWGAKPFGRSTDGGDWIRLGPLIADRRSVLFLRGMVLFRRPVLFRNNDGALASAIAHIRYLEYSYDMQETLRTYKASVFQALSHPTRIAILEVLRDGELSAGTIQEKLGVEQANLSQHLAILRSRQIVANRKDGNQVFYSIRNPVLVEVLDVMRRYFQTNLADAIQMLEEVGCEASAR